VNTLIISLLSHILELNFTSASRTSFEPILVYINILGLKSHISDKQKIIKNQICLGKETQMVSLKCLTVGDLFILDLKFEQVVLQTIVAFCTPADYRHRHKLNFLAKLTILGRIFRVIPL